MARPAVELTTESGDDAGLCEKIAQARQVYPFPEGVKPIGQMTHTDL